jgi:dTDP-4-amino-4,6-dideoxygalactose transaminase
MYERPTPPVTAKKSVIGLNLPTYHEISQEDVTRVGEAVNEELSALFPS